MSLDQFDSLSHHELFVLMKFVRRTIENHGEPVQDSVIDLLMWLGLSVNTFAKAMEGLTGKGLIRKEKGIGNEPLKYMVALPFRCEEIPNKETGMEPVSPIPAIPEILVEASLKETLRALLFLSGQHLSAVRLTEITHRSIGDVVRTLDELRVEMQETSVVLIQTASGYTMETRKEFAEFTRKVLTRKQRPTKTPQRQYSVLAAIVAKERPATIDEIADIRGSRPGASLDSLLRKGYLGIVHSTRGLPHYYLTQKCLDALHVRSFEELVARAHAHRDEHRQEGDVHSPASDDNRNSII